MYTDSNFWSLYSGSNLLDQAMAMMRSVGPERLMQTVLPVEVTRAGDKQRMYMIDGDPAVMAEGSDRLAKLMEHREDLKSLAHESPSRVVNNVAIIQVRGLIVKDPGLLTAFGFATSSRMIEMAVRQATADEEVKQILIVFDSPGGSVSGLREAADAVLEAREAKTVIAQVDGMCASAAYYIASQCTRIIAGRNDLVGSLGTRMLLYDFSKMFEKEGVEAVPFDTGEHKSAGVMGAELTEPQRAEFQRIVDFFGADFRAIIERGRVKMDRGTVAELFDGRIWPGVEAKRLGLIDKIGTLRETFATVGGQSRSKRTAAQVVRQMRIADARAG